MSLALLIVGCDKNYSITSPGASAGQTSQSTGGSPNANPSRPGDPNDVAGGGGTACVPGVLTTTTQMIKFLFVLDTSGSNAGSNGTDPDKTVRGGSLQQFFTDYNSKSNFYWALDYFQGSTATPLTSGFSSSSTVFQGAINSFMQVVDSGSTPYQAAMSLAESQISSDPDLNSASAPKYVVVFMSDGQPTDYGSNIVAAAEADVQTLMNIAPGRITFNTVFYGQPEADQQAPTVMQGMATTGSGIFLDTSTNPSGKDFQVSNIINIPGQTCP
jgi:hypothetical protein